MKLKIAQDGYAIRYLTKHLQVFLELVNVGKGVHNWRHNKLKKFRELGRKDRRTAPYEIRAKKKLDRD